MESFISAFNDSAKDYTVYNVTFRSFDDLYLYLKANPKVNTDIFTNRMSTTSRYADKLGRSLDESIEFLRSGYPETITDFTTNFRFANINAKEKEGYTNNLGVYGGIPVASLVAQGINECMLSANYDSEIKKIDLYCLLAYPMKISNEQIINRGLLIIYLLKTLQNEGYYVNLHFFELAKSDMDANHKEMFHMVINLNSLGESLTNLEKCFYPLIGKEFLRRIIYRIMESTPFKEPVWNRGYGIPCSLEQIRKFYNLKEDDILIGTANDLGIKGQDLNDDLQSFLSSLNLVNKVDVKKMKILERK